MCSCHGSFGKFYKCQMGRKPPTKWENVMIIFFNHRTVCVSVLVLLWQLCVCVCVCVCVCLCVSALVCICVFLYVCLHVWEYLCRCGRGANHLFKWLSSGEACSGEERWYIQHLFRVSCYKHLLFLNRYFFADRNINEQITISKQTKPINSVA